MNHKDYKKVKKIFQSAIGVAPDKRSSFLDRECRGNEELRGEVVRLIAAEDSVDTKSPAPAQNTDAIPKDKIGKEPTKIFSGSSIDNQFGHYKVISKIGEGGMGEVFLAKDTTLDRNVALKILPPALTNDDERMRRFEQEARAASSLNHPFILTIHEFRKNTDGRHFIVSEHVVGKTLDEHFALNKIDLSAKLNIAIQLASALEASHEAGIIHRDIKPANIMVRPDGFIKVLDFGLAKLMESFKAQEGDSEVATRFKVETGSRTIMGTAPYMSPEQVRGGKTDQRTDIWSLGVVLYEMLTGERPFIGETEADTVASILKKEPRMLSTLQGDLPPGLDQIVARTINKNVDGRYQTMSKLKSDLEEIKKQFEISGETQRLSSDAKQKSGDGRDSPLTDHKKIHESDQQGETTDRTAAYETKSFLSGSPGSWLRVLGLAAAGGAVAIFLMWLTGINQPTVNDSAKTSFNSVDVESWSAGPSELYSRAAFSPDGEKIAFGSTRTGPLAIWVKQNNTGDPLRVTKDEFYNRYPVWSPNGKEIAYYSAHGDEYGVWRIPHLGGTPKLIGNVEYGGTTLLNWGKSGKIYYSGETDLFSMDEQSGKSTRITDFASDKKSIGIILISPNEERIALVRQHDDSAKIAIKAVNSDVEKVIASIPGEIRTMVWHPDGTSLFYSSLIDGFVQVFEKPVENGDAVQLTFHSQDSLVQDVSTDGNSILIGSAIDASDLWRVGIDDRKESVFEDEVSAELWPDLSPDGESIVYQSIKYLSQANNLFDGSIIAAPLLKPSSKIEISDVGYLPQWSGDGKYIGFLKYPVGGGVEIWTAKNNGTESRKLTSGDIENAGYTISPYNRTEVSNFAWSPFESKIAYVASRNGLPNIWIADAGGTGDSALTSNTEKDRRLFCPIWKSDGKKIAFSTRTAKRDSEGKFVYQLRYYDQETRQESLVFETKQTIRLIGWSENESELYFIYPKMPDKKFDPTPSEVFFRAVAIESGKDRDVNVLKDAYVYNIHLSPDRSLIGYVSRAADQDEIWVSPVNGDRPTRLITNNDPKLFISSLAWSADGKVIYFGKQSRFSLLSMLKRKGVNR